MVRNCDDSTHTLKSMLLRQSLLARYRNPTHARALRFFLWLYQLHSSALWRAPWQARAPD